jgi:glycosyltransferase involved in cell wall biosynthesis
MTRDDGGGVRIAIALSGPLAANGVCRVAESWARMLADAGHEPTLAFEAGERTLDVAGCRVAPYPAPPSQSRLTQSSARQRGAVRALASLHRREAFDLAISHDPRISVGLRRALPQLPILQTVHSPLVDEDRLNNWKYADGVRRRLTYPATRALSWRIERRALRSIDHCHTLSAFTWHRLSRRHPRVCRALPWDRIPGTFDERRFHPAADRRAVRQRLGLPPDATLVVSVRRLVPRNGIERILACAAQVASRAPRVRFLIGGTGPLEERLRREIRARDVSGSVEMLGFVPEDVLPAYYQAADALLLPTRDLECFGLPVVEGMACGCTPLVVPEGGPPEIVPEARYVASANSAQAVATLVSAFVEGRIAAPREPFADWARARFSEAAVAPAVLDLVRRVAAGTTRT